MEDPEEDVELGALLVANLPRLEGYLRQRMGPRLAAHESASDLAQSICREILSSRERFEYRDGPSFRGWLFLHARRRLARRGRYWAAACRRPGSRAEVPDLDAHHVTDQTPSRDAIAREQLEAFAQAFERLSAEQRRVLALCRGMGLTAVETAERLGKTPSAVRVTLHRALARLVLLEEQLRGG